MKNLTFFLIYVFFSTPIFALSFSEKLYSEGDYYRAITESKREQSQTSDRVKLNILKLRQARAAFKLSHYVECESLATAVLASEGKNTEALNLKGLSLMRQNKIMAAKSHFKKNYSGETWPKVEQKNANLAQKISYVLPGSGLFYAGSPWKGAASLTLNAIFIKAISDAMTAGNEATALLLFTFEMGWYFGGANAALEEAERFNGRQNKAIELQLFQVDF